MPLLFLFPLLFIFSITLIIMSRTPTDQEQDVNRTREIGKLIDQKAMKLLQGKDVSDIDEQLRQLHADKP